MKILHTSDLHLGRSFHGRSLQADQEAICAELVRVCARQQVDAVLIAGDVYDQASPRTEVIQLLSRLLGELNAQGTTVVLTSGNHDSAARLGFGGKLCIHPQQIEIVNQGFSPSDTDVTWARTVVEAAGGAEPQ